MRFVSMLKRQTHKCHVVIKLLVILHIRGLLVWIAQWVSCIMIENYHFYRFSRKMRGQILKLNHDRFITISFQLIIYYSAHRHLLCSVIYTHSHYLNTSTELVLHSGSGEINLSVCVQWRPVLEWEYFCIISWTRQ
jgi:hypothetical protein